MQTKFPSPEQVHLDQEAVLYINHAVVQVEALNVKGALVVEGQPGVAITIAGLEVDNQGWEWLALEGSDDGEEQQQIRCSIFLPGTVVPSYQLVQNVCLQSSYYAAGYR